MAEVVIDGVHYTPSSNQVSVGVAVTTRDRPEVLAHCLEQIRKHTPKEFPVVVVDDASSPPASDATYRFERNVGIPAAKNKSLELLMDSGVEHLFLFDNDAYPMCDEWWKPFTEHPEPHLMGQFLDFATGQKINDIKCIFSDGEIEAFTGPRGYCLYFHRSVIEAVGGFDPVFGMGLFEHGDLSNRIFNKGLTTWRYASPTNSTDFVESGDRLRKVQRTPLPDRQALVDRNRAIHDERYLTCTDFVPYRAAKTLILTSLLTGLPDPQRPRPMKPHPSLVAELVKSAGNNPVVILADQLDTVPGAEVVKVPTTINPYFARWIHQLRYLESVDVDFVLCCDATDVQVLQPDRLGSLPRDKILVGSETQILDCEWMRKNHPHALIQKLMDDYGRHTLLNSGVLAGPKSMIVEFLQHMVHTWADIEVDEWHGRPGNGSFEMGLFSYTALTRFADRLLFGPWVTTRFRANETTEIAFAKHK